MDDRHYTDNEVVRTESTVCLSVCLSRVPEQLQLAVKLVRYLLS